LPASSLTLALSLFANWRDESGAKAWAAGIERFLPEIKVKKYNPYSGALSYLYKPFFPRYLFAGFVPSKTTAVRWRCELFMSPAGLYRNCSFSRNCAHTGKEW
jgi:hypothetical protein